MDFSNILNINPRKFVIFWNILGCKKVLVSSNNIIRFHHFENFKFLTFKNLEIPNKQLCIFLPEFLSFKFLHVFFNQFSQRMALEQPLIFMALEKSVGFLP